MRRFSPWGVVTALLGLGAMAWMVRSVGLARIADDVRNVGWMLVAIIAIGGLRFLMRAAAWRLCLEPPHHLSLGDAFAAVVSGDTIGNITPLGINCDAAPHLADFSPWGNTMYIVCGSKLCRRPHPKTSAMPSESLDELSYLRPARTSKPDMSPRPQAQLC